jgi:arsenite methyltransferase
LLRFRTVVAVSGIFLGRVSGKADEGEDGMTGKSANQIREEVRAEYGGRAAGVIADSGLGCCGTGGTTAKQRYYEAESVADLPDSAVSYGCGNPIAIAELRTGETVLDLGSGAGLDCFLAARRVGPEGSVIGVDMTDEMLVLAEQNKEKLGAATVEFRKGFMEALPVADASVDVIISNCVINLAPDKDPVFSEAFRVLRPGGRLQISDIVLLRDLSASDMEDGALWTGCKAGALVVGDYISRLERAGFVNVTVAIADRLAGGTNGDAWRSGRITAAKPGESSAPAPLHCGERIEVVDGSGGSACCGSDCCTTDAVS